MTWAAVGIGSIVSWRWLSYVSFLASRYFFVARFPDEIQLRHHQRRLAHRASSAIAPTDPRRTRRCLLVHGLAANRYNLDLTDETSLARHLQRARLRRLASSSCAAAASRCVPSSSAACATTGPSTTTPSAICPAPPTSSSAPPAPARSHLVGFSTGALACYAWLSDPHRTVDVAVAWSRSAAPRRSSASASRSRAGSSAASASCATAGCCACWRRCPATGTRRRSRSSTTPRTSTAPMQRRIDGQHDRQLLAHRAARSTATGSCTTSSARSISGATTAPSSAASPCRRCSWPDRATSLSPPDAVKDTHDAVGSTRQAVRAAARARRACASTTVTSIW